MSTLKKRLIIVDDDHATINYNLELAKRTPYFESINSFGSAEDVLTYLQALKEKKELFDGSMIIDVYLEEMDGLELLDEMIDSELVDSSVEILVLTGKNSARSREKTKISQLNAKFSLKPLTQELLSDLAGSHA